MENGQAKVRGRTCENWGWSPSMTSTPPGPLMSSTASVSRTWRRRRWASQFWKIVSQGGCLTLWFCCCGSEPVSVSATANSKCASGFPSKVENHIKDTCPNSNLSWAICYRFPSKWFDLVDFMTFMLREIYMQIFWQLIPGNPEWR